MIELYDKGVIVDKDYKIINNIENENIKKIIRYY